MKNHHEFQPIQRRPETMIPQTAAKIRAQIAQFSGKLSWGLCKPLRRLIEEMIYGIQARQSVHLTEIGRSLEEQIPLVKTVNRLSRNLARPEIRPIVQKSMVRFGAGRIDDDTLLVLDLSDLTKPYAKKMENLARVRDGSTGEITNGYWLCQVVGVETQGQEITPLYGELYSQSAIDFISENEEIFKAIRLVSRATEKRGVWVIDRGGDRREIYDEVVPKDKGLRFIIRMEGSRHLLSGKIKKSALSLAGCCPLPYATTVIREEAGKERPCFVEYGFRPVRLPEYPDVELWLVVVTGFGQQPMMLLTNVPMRKNRKVLWWAVSSYLTRWRIEETIRFGKQCYALEDVRVLRYQRLRNLMVLVVAAMFFASVVLGTKMKLSILASHVLKASKRLFGIPDFRYYALADGIKELLTRFPRGKMLRPRGDPTAEQISLFVS
jgi:hypothetical protein